MYGLVNQAIRDMVLESFDAETWERIRSNAGADDVFVTMQQYPDELTVALVESACGVLGAEPHEVLKMFGRYWVGYTARTYGALFDMSGRSLVSFVRNLNNLHTRVGHMMPELKPPSFTVTDLGDESFRLHYYSSRSGLQPMLVGLLEGLGLHFQNDVDVVHECGAEDGDGHDEFFVKFRSMT